MVRQVWGVISMLLFLYFLVLIARLVLEWVRALARDWRPRGPLLVLAEGVYSLTDPPLRFLRRIIPPLRFGGVQLDLGLLILLLVTSTLMGLRF